jgi:hypothetical protein
VRGAPSCAQPLRAPASARAARDHRSPPPARRRRPPPCSCARAGGGIMECLSRNEPETAAACGPLRGEICSVLPLSLLACESHASRLHHVRLGTPPAVRACTRSRPQAPTRAAAGLAWTCAHEFAVGARACAPALAAPRPRRRIPRSQRVPLSFLCRATRIGCGRHCRGVMRASPSRELARVGYDSLTFCPSMPLWNQSVDVAGVSEPPHSHVPRG